MRRMTTIALLSSALIAAAIGDVSARDRSLGYGAWGYAPPPMYQGRSAWVAGRSRAGAACTIYSCPNSYTPGVPLNPEGNITPNGIP
jgi:hypothetical protein